ncbi:hypothetical protein BJ996_005968 [Streptomyces phaeogriseichromatogenes]|nr:hypothetical protein [Streptomyces murinus]
MERTVPQLHIHRGIRPWATTAVSSAVNSPLGHQQPAETPVDLGSFCFWVMAVSVGINPHGYRTRNPEPQREDVPDVLNITRPGPGARAGSAGGWSAVNRAHSSRCRAASSTPSRPGGAVVFPIVVGRFDADGDALFGHGRSFGISSWSHQARGIRGAVGALVATAATWVDGLGPSSRRIAHRRPLRGLSLPMPRAPQARSERNRPGVARRFCDVGGCRSVFQPVALKAARAVGRLGGGRSPPRAPVVPQGGHRSIRRSAIDRTGRVAAPSSTPSRTSLPETAVGLVDTP